MEVFTNVDVNAILGYAIGGGVCGPFFWKISKIFSIMQSKLSEHEERLDTVEGRARYIEKKIMDAAF